MSTQSSYQDSGNSDRPINTVPCTRTMKARTTGSQPLKMATTGCFEQPIHVLLVDDEPSLLELCKLYIEHPLYMKVTTAESAADALEKIRKMTFDAIVSDYQMPEIDGITFLKMIRETYTLLPFILFTGKGREEVVIDAINNGATFYVQKGGETKVQYAELSHKIRRAVDHYRSETTLRETNAVLNAILAASPNGIALIRERTLQWVNDSLSRMLGYSHSDLIGMHLRKLYENEETYNQIGEQIVRELKKNGRSKVTTRFLHQRGFAIDCEIQIAPLDQGNLHFGHMIMMTDVSKKLAAARELKSIAAFPHLELTPVIELNINGRITYFNDAAIDALIKYGNGARLESFIPSDIREILGDIDRAELHSVYRNVKVGLTEFRVHVTLSSRFRIARISAIHTGEKSEEESRS
ncbi:MAG: response regulator [Methanoregula sp.]